MLQLLFYGFLYDQPHMLHPFAVLIAGGDDINAGGIDTAVTENIGKLGDIFFDPIKYSCK